MRPTTCVLQINLWAVHVPYTILKLCTCTLKAEFARLLNLMRDQCIKLASHESESTCLRKISRQQPPSCQICSFFRLSANAHKYQRMISGQGTYLRRMMTIPSDICPRLLTQTILQHESLHITRSKDLIFRHSSLLTQAPHLVTA